MYPILETYDLRLVPLKENDFEDMHKLFSCPSVIAMLEDDFPAPEDRVAFTKIYHDWQAGGEFYSIWQKESGMFLGVIVIHQHIDKKKITINHSQLWVALLPEHWNKGVCTEATCALLHFAFLGIKTPLIYANQFHINPAAGQVLKKNGFSYYKTYKMKNQLYNQYRYFRADYLQDNEMSIKKDMYDFTLTLRKSPYSYEHPIRKIDSISHIKQPTKYLCGQAVIAMLAEVSVDEVIDVVENDKGMSVSEVSDALYYYGIKHAKARTRVAKDTILPDICILSIRLPGYGHWSLYYKGTYYDPEFGPSTELPKNAILNHYWKIYGE